VIEGGEGMEALLGILVGAIIGFFLQQIATRFSRQRRKTDLARALHTEISLDKKGLQNALEVFTQEKDRRRLTRPRGPSFTRTVYTGCIGDLALLPRDTRYQAQRFYACVNDVEYLVGLGEEWQRLNNTDREYLVDNFLRAANAAIERAGEAIRELERLTES
jgi:hypothetical protein